MQDIEDILTAATEHGLEAGLDMEIGDLQGILRAIVETMSPDERAKLLTCPEVTAIFEITERQVPREDEALDAVLKAAEVHGGYDDPEHEAGDLQDAIRAGWTLLDDEGRSVVLGHEGLAGFAKPAPANLVR